MRLGPAALAVALLGGLACGGGGGSEGPDTSPPTLVSSSPQLGIEAVPAGTALTLTFSERIDPAGLAVELVIGGTAVPVTRSLDAGGTVLTLSHAPLTSLPAGATLTVSGVADLAGNPLADQPVVLAWTYVAPASCAAPTDCPAAFRTAPRCTVPGSATTCQGTRIDATCAGGRCGSEVIEDDSACAGQVHGCGGFPPIACTGAASQPEPVCATRCTPAGGCIAGYACDAAEGGTCVPQATFGQACVAVAGGAQGTCAGSLKCENAVCCSAASAGSCCARSDQCPGNLACSTSECKTSCSAGTTADCADPTAQYCDAHGACQAKKAPGQPCAETYECAEARCFEGACCRHRSCGSDCGNVPDGCGRVMLCGPCPP